MVPAAIETPFTFFQKPVEVVRRQAVETTELPLRLVPEVLNPIDMMPSLGHKGLAVIDAPVMKLRDIQHIVRREPIRIDDTVRYLFTNDRQKRSRSCIRDNRSKDLSASF